MRLLFSLPGAFTHDRLLALFEAMGTALTGRPIKLVRREHREGSDPSLLDACFVSRWSDGAVVFDQRVELDDESAGYLHSVELSVPGRTLRASDSGLSPFFTRLELEVEPCSPLEAHTLRALLRRELGAEHDHCPAPWLGSS